MTLAIVIAVLVVALLAFAATRPDSFRIERATTIKAPPEKIFALIDDFHGWAAWSPWEKIDPSMKRPPQRRGERERGQVRVGGNGKAGKGSMEIIRVDPLFARHRQARFHQALRGPQHR